MEANQVEGFEQFHLLLFAILKFLNFEKIPTK